MTPENFCYWLQGFIELTGTETITEGQLKSIKEHLQKVFKKETPPVDFNKGLSDLMEDIRRRNPPLPEGTPPFVAPNNPFIQPNQPFNPYQVIC